MRRQDLQRIAQTKIDDAETLLQLGRPTNAYYLAGYAIEIGLKSCIAKQISADTIPELSFIRSIYDHDIQKLAKVAGLSSILKDEQDRNPRFAANWAIVCEWGPDVRYAATDMGTAQIMLGAVNEQANGVLPWIKVHW